MTRTRIPPWLMVVVILIAFGGGALYVRHFVENVLKPRQLAQHREKISRDIALADEQFRRKRWMAAVQQYQFVLRAYPSDLDAARRGAIQHRAGAALRQEGLRKRDKALLDRARTALMEALTLNDDIAPSVYRETQSELGRLHATYFELSGDRAALDASLAAWRAALRVTNAAEDPAAYAEIWLQVGNALRSIYEARPESGDIAPALDAYGRALEVSTQTADPAGHARAQVERAAALLAAAPRQSTHRYSTWAADALQQALTALDGDADRPAYGRAQKLLGDAYMLLASHPPSNLPDNWHYQHKYRHESLARRAYELAEQAGVPRGAETKSPN